MALHQELAEDPNEAAIREVKEEVGLDIKLEGGANLQNDSAEYTDLVCPVFMNRHRISERHEHVTLIYFATAQTQILNPPSTPEGTAECRWFTAAELQSSTEVSEQVKRYAQAALHRLASQ